MLKEQVSKFMQIFKNTDGNNKKKIENIAVFIVLLIITIVAINIILKDNKKEGNIQTNSAGKTLAQVDSNSENNISNNENELKENLKQILSKIDGVGEVDVLITYSQSSETLAMYNEDNSKSDTEETDSRTEEIEK